MNDPKVVITNANDREHEVFRNQVDHCVEQFDLTYRALVATLGEHNLQPIWVALASYGGQVTGGMASHPKLDPAMLRQTFQGNFESGYNAGLTDGRVKQAQAELAARGGKKDG